MNTFTSFFLLAFIIALLVQFWLTIRHIRYIVAHRHQVPAPFTDKISLQDHHKAADYTVTHSRFGLIELVFGSLIILGWTLGGGLNLLDQAWRQLGFHELFIGVGVIISVFFIGTLLQLPLSLYNTFSIEEKFGFNKTSLKLFIIDTLKQTVLTLLLGAPMALLILWLMQSSGSLWWLYVWLVWTGFMLIMMWVYPTWIAPLFNKFIPLDNQELLQRINALLRRCGFASDGVFVMDGSRRSGHGNAYFTGFGNHKRIVFFDTLLHSLDGNEIEAVLAHELGHFKLRHIVKRVITMTLLSLISLAMLGWLIDQPWFYAGLGVDTPSTHNALLLFMIVLPVFSVFLQPISTFIMRKHEFEADSYAAKQSNARYLINALVKLYSENANTLTPDPLFSAFHDSHPPAPVRIAFLSSKLNDTSAEGAL